MFIEGWKVGGHSMTPEELLGVTPALLAKSILHRRERLAEVIPEQLDARQEELQAAEPLARAAKEKRDGVNAKVANLKKERSDAQTKARALFKRAGELREKLQASGGIKDPDPKWAKEKLWIRQDLDGYDISERCEDFYFNKTYKRVVKYLTDNGMGTDGPCFINGTRVPSIFDLIGKIDKKLRMLI